MTNRPSASTLSETDVNTAWKSTTQPFCLSWQYQSAITHVWQTHHLYLLPQHKSTVLPCNRQGGWMPGPWNGSSAKWLPITGGGGGAPAAPGSVSNQTMAHNGPGNTKLLQEGELTWGISQILRSAPRLWFGACLLPHHMLLHHSPASPEKTSFGTSKGTKNPPEIKFSTFSHLNPEKPTYLLFWLTSKNLLLSFASPGLGEEIAEAV